MTEITLKQFVTSLIFFGVVLSGMLHFSTGVFDTYDKDVDDDRLRSLSSHVNSETNSSVAQARRQTKDIGNPGSNVFGIAGFFVSGAWGVIVTVFKLITLIPTIMTEIIIALGLPSWVMGLVSIPIALVLLKILDVIQGGDT